MAGLQTFKQKALIYLEFAKGTAPLEQLAERTKELESQLQMSTTTNSELASQLEDLTKKFNKLAEKVATK
jgi:predicted RNase H-like nuclease (RuvC/YqgF family)